MSTIPSKQSRGGRIKGWRERRFGCSYLQREPAPQKEAAAAAVKKSEKYLLICIDPTGTSTRVARRLLPLVVMIHLGILQMGNEFQRGYTTLDAQT
jgi:hypothetical protein